MPSESDRFLIGAVVGLAALISAFLYGLSLGKSKSEEAIAKLTAEKAQQQAEYESKISEAKNTIVTQYIDKWHTIKEIKYVNVERAKNVVPSQYKLSNGWVSTHDSAARATEVDDTAAADSTPSGVRDNQALVTVINNYAKYHSCQAQVNSLLDLIEKHNKTIDDINRRKP